MSKNRKINFPGWGFRTPAPESSIEFEEAEVGKAEEVDLSDEISDEVFERIKEVINDDDNSVPVHLKDRVLRDYRGRPIKINGKFVTSSIPLSILFPSRLMEDED